VFVSGGPPVNGGDCPSGGLYAFHIESGDEAWHTCTTGQVVSPGALTGGVLFVAQQDAVVAYDTATGRLLQSLRQSGAHWGGVAIAHGYLVDGSVSGVLYYYSVHDFIS
jgi:outer membrane protein assembly factor BamB